MFGTLVGKAVRITGKAFKMIAIGVAALIALIVALLLWRSALPAAPNDYEESAETGGDIEAKYLKAGPFSVKRRTESAPDPLKKIEVYYPAELPDSQSQYPAVILVNGTGVPASKYKALFRHLASWGFLVAGNEDPNSGTGQSADLTLQYLLNQNSDPNSVFFEKLDTENIGISGHSQGGAGVLCSVSVGEYADFYKAAAALSPTHEETARALGWNYEPDKISAPLLMFAGTEGDFETQLVLPFEKMTELYDKISGPKGMARRSGAEHGDMLYSADGYVTAWFMWRLKGDAEAAKAFTGPDAELLRNERYQDQRIDMEQELTAHDIG